MNDRVEKPVRCNNCQAILAESPNLAAENRQPCPTCGSLSRNLSVSINETIRVSSHISMLQERQGEAIGFSESERKGTASGSSLLGNNTLQFSIDGACPQGEQDTPTACEVLLTRMRELGYHYGTALKSPNPADDYMFSNGPKDKCPQRVQVVRAIPPEELWHQLSKNYAVSENLSIMRVIEELREAIRFKASNRKIAPKDRPDLILALDATRIPGLAFDRIVWEFRRSEGSWAASLGFKAIWLVGPIPLLTRRLDSEDM